jgi:hypothetical protein
MKSNATKALKQIQRVIQSLEDRKLEIIQDEFAVPLTEIVSIAREHELTLDLISYAMMHRNLFLGRTNDPALQVPHRL